MSSFGFEVKLWEEWPKVISRSRAAHFSLDQALIRYTKNYMSEKAYFENIKARKFAPLLEEGSIGKVWMELKEFVAVIETNSGSLTNKYKEYMDATTKELKEYENAFKQIEIEYNLIKKRKESALLEINKKRERYVQIFKDWDEFESQAAQTKNELGPYNSKTMKVQKVATDKQVLKDNAESQYIDAIKNCQAAEKDYDQKASELLNRFENLEIQRVQTLHERLVDFFTSWHQNSHDMTKLLEKCVEGIKTVNPLEDIQNFANTDLSNKVHPPYQLAVLCQRTHGPDVPSPNASSPYVQGSHGSIVSSTPIVVPSQARQPLQQGQQSGRPEGGGIGTTTPASSPSSLTNSGPQPVLGGQQTSINRLPASQASFYDMPPQQQQQQNRPPSLQSSFFDLPPQQQASSQSVLPQQQQLMGQPSSQTSFYSQTPQQQQTSSQSSFYSPAQPQQPSFSQQQLQKTPSGGYPQQQMGQSLSQQSFNSQTPPQQQQQQQQPQQQQQGALGQNKTMVVGNNVFHLARVIEAYNATSGTEATVSFQETVMILPDVTDSGWVYCLKQAGNGGYVPTESVELV